MASEEFAAALECAPRVLGGAATALIADALVVRGLDVSHIDPRGGAEPHRLSEAAVVDGTRIVYPPAQGQLGV
jgi:hypothetical protein